MNGSEETPVARSPDGGLLLIKREVADGFELMVRPWPELDRVVACGKVRHSPMGLQWRPDGKAVGFLARHDGPLFRPWIWTVGDEPRVLDETPATSFAVLAPAWHPEGQHFLYWAEGNLYSVAVGFAARSFRGAAGRAGFAWSPEGDQFAAVGVLRPGHLQVLGPEGKREALIAVCPGGVIRDVSWTRRGLFVTAREAGSEWYQVGKVELSGTCEWLSDGPGDKRRPTERSDGSMAWETHLGGVISISSDDGDALNRRPDTALPYSGYQAKGWRLEFVSPSGVVAVDEQRDREAVTYPNRVRMEKRRATSVNVTSSDGAVMPGWLWEPDVTKGLVIDVHGAPHIAASPYHTPGVRLLLEQGIAVLAINFRGSGGGGRALEELAGDPAEDLLAARRWVAQRWPGVPRVLHGQSFGALLALRSALSSPSEELAGIVLVSLRLPKEKPRPSGRLGFPIAAFHGGWDLVAPPQETRAYLQEISREADVRFTELREEGHAFHRQANRLRSYETAASMVLAHTGR